jgi:hypothetical protein
MVGEALAPHQLSALQRTRNGCPPLTTATTMALGRIDSDCVQFNAAVVADLARRRGDGLRGVILNARWLVYLNVPTPNPRETFVRALTRVDAHPGGVIDANARLGVWPHDQSGALQTLERSLRDTFAQLQTIGLDVMVVAPTPEMSFTVPECLARRPERSCVTTRAAVAARRAGALAAIRAAASGFERVRVWDPIDSLCDAETCFVARDGIVMYTDEDHFTASWSRRLARPAAEVVDWLVR